MKSLMTSKMKPTSLSIKRTSNSKKSSKVPKTPSTQLSREESLWSKGLRDKASTNFQDSTNCNLQSTTFGMTPSQNSTLRERKWWETYPAKKIWWSLKSKMKGQRYPSTKNCQKEPRRLFWRRDRRNSRSRYQKIRIRLRIRCWVSLIRRCWVRFFRR